MEAAGPQNVHISQSLQDVLAREAAHTPDELSSQNRNPTTVTTEHERNLPRLAFIPPVDPTIVDPPYNSYTSNQSTSCIDLNERICKMGLFTSDTESGRSTVKVNYHR